MIGKGKSISHTGASMAYGWNESKNAEVVFQQNLAGENPKEVTEEFKIIQGQNERCKKNTLSFVLSPTIEDGKKLSAKQLQELTQRFANEMKLNQRQAIAFVHRDKEHVHLHLYVNRIDFQGKAYKDSYIGKRSQKAAEKVANQMGLSTVKEIQQEKLNQLHQTRAEIKQISERVMTELKPKDFDQYIKFMRKQQVKVIPSINRQNQLQGFRFEYKEVNLKGSEVHRSMSGGKLSIQISANTQRGLLPEKGNVVKLSNKAVELSANLAMSLAKNVLKKIIKKSIDIGIGI